jgi:hypothetical protein
MRFFSFIAVVSFITIFSYAIAQELEDTTKAKDPAIEQLKYKQQPGLALAASKIFFSDKRYAISGFGEFNYVPLQTGISSDLGDIELYYTGLYRYATFFGYRFTDKLIWNSEFQIELLHAGLSEFHYEIVIEAFIDYLANKHFKTRFGFFPLTIGYVNNNDEPVMFYSVNRSDVERIINPSTWIEFGAMFYGDITDNWSYALGLTQGLNSANYLSGTWIRQGREIRLDVPNTITFNPQINYTGIENLTLSASGYFGNSGQKNSVEINNSLKEIRANIQLITGYAKYDWKNWRFVTLGVLGQLSDTDLIYAQTMASSGQGQVLGSKAYGYLFEAGCDILPRIRKNKTIEPKHNFLLNREEMKLVLFGRAERLNTHYGLIDNLAMNPRVENNLMILTGGLNFNTKENIVFKANYRFAKNFFEEDPEPLKHIVEFGFGFIF